MDKIYFFVPALCTLVLCACDLQPKISSIPDSVGMFIEDRYPALLADPNKQPEIYNSAVTDYGVYASPELYGSGNIDDYVLYASVDDYVLVPGEEEKKDEIKPALKEEQEKETEDTDEESQNVQEDEENDEDEIFSDYLVIPVYGGNTVIDEMPNEEEKPKQETEKKEEIKPKEEKVAEVKSTKEPEKKDIKPVENKIVDADTIVVERGDTLYSLARKNNTTIAELARINSLKEPYNLSVGQKLKIRAKEPQKIEKPVPNVISTEKVKQIKEEKAAKKKETVVVKETIKPTSTKRVDVQEITVGKGDTLYSLSRKYEIPVNDLAVMNKLSAPFGLQVGQKLKVPKLENVQTRSATVVKKTEPQKSVKPKEEKPKVAAQNDKKVKTDSVKKTSQKPVEKKNEAQKKAQVQQKPQQKTEQKNTTNSNTQKTQAKIAPRSSSKFSWPVSGKILSGYGPKNGGLVNDGINISAAMGTVVKAAENGVVAYAGNEVKGMGNLIIIQHSDGWMTVYAHLSSMDVKRGARVSVGQPIGKIGKTGKVDKPQLHFEIRKGTKSYNPTTYLKK